VFASSTPEDTEAQLRALLLTADVTTGCRINGARCEFGTVYAAPSKSDRASIAALVAVGTKTLEQCAKQPDQDGCIIARRRFTYARGTTLRFEMRLDLDCQGKACDAYNTCSKGSCGSSEVRCEGTACDVSPDAGVAPVPFSDAGSSDTGVADDAGQHEGGPTDSGADSALSPSCPASSRCRQMDMSFRACAGNEVCCVNPYGAPGPPGCVSMASPCAFKGCCSGDARCGAGLQCCIVTGGSACVAEGTCPIETRPCDSTSDCGDPAYECIGRPPLFGFFGNCTKVR
jgi:hypothetical protein